GLAFAAGGRRLASPSHDLTALVWDLTGGVLTESVRPEPPAALALEQCWTDLAAADAAPALQAVWQLAVDRARSVPFLRNRLSPVPLEIPATVAAWVTALD